MTTAWSSAGEYEDIRFETSEPQTESLEILPGEFAKLKHLVPGLNGRRNP